MTDETPLNAPADQDFILTCYEVFLGREVETLDVVRDRTGWPKSEVIHSFVASPEFVEQVLPALETGYPFIGDRFRGEPSLRQRSWAAEELPISAQTKERIRSIRIWREMLIHLLEDCGFASAAGTSI